MTPHVATWHLLALKVHVVEAAGIEPASRNISAQASTCVVVEFDFAPRAPRRQGYLGTSQELGLIASVPDSDSRRVAIGDGRPGHCDSNP